MSKTEFFLASSLEKVFPCRKPRALDGTTLSVWGGMRAAVQLVFRASDYQDGSLLQSYTVSVKGAPVPAELYLVELLPSDFPCWENAAEDENYLTHEPGLFPDLLTPLEDGRIRPVPRQYRSVWISFPVTEDTVPGNYEVTVEASPGLSQVTGSGGGLPGNRQPVFLAACGTHEAGKTEADSYGMVLCGLSGGLLQGGAFKRGSLGDTGKVYRAGRTPSRR